MFQADLPMLTQINVIYSFYFVAQNCVNCPGVFWRNAEHEGEMVHCFCLSGKSLSSGRDLLIWHIFQPCVSLPLLVFLLLYSLTEYISIYGGFNKGFR